MEDYPQRRLPRLGHPRRQQRQCPIGLPDDKVFSASMGLRSEHHDHFAAARVKGVADPNLKNRTLGSMTLFR
jgi:hypothetical protein